MVTRRTATAGIVGLGGSLAILVLVACAPRTGGPELPLDPPGSFSAEGTAEVPDRWWTAFGDPELNRLVDRALGSNFDLAAAWERLREARAVVERERSDLFPDLDGFLEGNVRRDESDFGADDDFGEEEDFGDTEELRLGLSASYELDLWGRIHSSVEAERYRAEAGLADYRTAALSLSAEVARTWFQVVEARNRLALLDEQIEADEKVERLLENRFGTGQIRGVDVLRQRQLVESTREQRIVVESRLRVLEHLLAVLVGNPPQEGVRAEAPALPALPPLPETGLPMELVRRRPDIRRAYRLLQAADRDLAAAIANQYPRLTLSASLTTTDDAAVDLFEEWTRSFTAGLLTPLFRAGELEAEVDRAEAVRRRRLHEYGQATLVAFQEVEDALVQEAKQRERIRSLERQVELAERSYEQLRIQYFNGLGDYIDVLVALTERQRLGRELIGARRELLELRIGLYRSLAGGFETGREDRSESRSRGDSRGRPEAAPVLDNGAGWS